MIEFQKDIICWWSGGITSAVACKCAIDIYGKERCRCIMIDTDNEDEDTYRFKKDCEKWYEIDIEIITAIGVEYNSIDDVWDKYLSLNVATGAICSTHLKRKVRERWEKNNEYSYQVFGYEFIPKEFNRALGMTMNHFKAKPIYPLLMFGYDKRKCADIIKDNGITIPRMYNMGFHNNNCFKSGCVQGGIGYWQKIKREFPEKFEKMAYKEHELTEKKGKPVTMLKSQSKSDKELIIEGWENFVFLKKNDKYPQIKCIDDMPECKVEPLFECNGFCGINDLIEKPNSAYQLNFDN